MLIIILICRLDHKYNKLHCPIEAFLSRDIKINLYIVWLEISLPNRSFRYL